MFDEIQKAILPLILQLVAVPVLGALGYVLVKWVNKLGALADAKAAQVLDERVANAASVIVKAKAQTMPLKPGSEKLASALADAEASPLPITRNDLEAAVAEEKRHPAPVRGATAVAPYPEPSPMGPSKDGGAA